MARLLRMAVFLGAVIAFCFAGCGDDDDDGDGRGGDGGVAGAGGGTAGSGGEGGFGGTGGVGGSGGEGGDQGPTERRLEADDNFFSPRGLEAAPGDTIVIENVGQMDHTFTSGACDDRTCTPGESGNVSFDEELAPGESVTVTIPEDAVVGAVVPFFCRLHGSTMTGTLTIVE